MPSLSKAFEESRASGYCRVFSIGCLLGSLQKVEESLSGVCVSQMMFTEKLGDTEPAPQCGTVADRTELKP